MKIGMFDSGVGGLTVLKEFINLFPEQSYVYFGDTARFPYGSKSKETIIRYSIESAIFLMQQGVDLLVVACGTATSQALHQLTKLFSIPVVGVIEPTVQQVIRTTKTKRIGIIATRGTVRSKVYQAEIAKHLEGASVFSQACPLLVSLIEEQVSQPHLIRLVIKEALAPLKKQKVDTLVLGSTHYPLLTSFIQEEMGPDVTLINQGQACAQSLQHPCSSTRAPATPTRQFFVSDDPPRFRATGEAFLGFAMPTVQKITLP